MKRAARAATWISLVVLGTIVPSISTAQIVIKKGTQVTIKPPLTVFTADRSVWNGILAFSTIVSTPAGQTALNGDDAWSTAGFPSLAQGTIEKINTKRVQNKKQIELEIRQANERIVYKFLFEPGLEDVSALAAELLLPGWTETAAADYRAISYKRIAERVFTGPLAALDTSKQLLLLTFANLTANSPNIASDEFRGETYLSVNLGSYSSILNELKFNQAARIAYVLNDQHLRVLKAWGTAVGDASPLYGLKIAFKVPHQNFLDKSTPIAYDDATLYAPSALIRQFQEAEITNQQFIDGCSVIVDDNRIAVNLTSTIP